MTLVVARIAGERIAIASDTRITEHGRILPVQTGVIKTCMVPGDICISFTNSPELAARDIAKFSELFPNGADFSDTISFFEDSSHHTGNDYLVAFDRNPKVVKIAEGRRVISAAKTLWIGDKAAYEAFREHESKKRERAEHGRAVNAVMFMDEMNASPASDLYSVMRNVVADPTIASTGGFVCVVSNRGNGFRHSVYSDMLFNWPDGADDFALDLNNQIDFGASGENSDYAAAQFSTGFMGLNCVAFYLLRGKKLFLFYGIANGVPTKCHVMSNVEPSSIQFQLNSALGLDLKWLLSVISASPNTASTTYRSPLRTEDPKGVGFAIMCHANTFPKPVDGQR